MKKKTSNIINLVLITAGFAISSCANATANNNSQSAKKPIIYIDDESKVFNNKQLVFFRENNPSTNSNAKEISDMVIKNAKKMPNLAIRITYKAESDMANQVASQVHQQISNQIYVEHCCKLDSGRVNLSGNQINISYYK